MKRSARLFTVLALVAALALGIAAVFLVPLRKPGVPPPPLTGMVDRIVIEKAARRMQLIQDGRPIRTYRIALGFAPQGDKLREGDGRTPEGTFRIDRRNAQSAFHLSLGLDYPQEEDLIRASAGGYNPGGDIFIHGQPNALADGVNLPGDWTAGCIALTNAEMREVWQVTPVGTVVEILP